jgi:hypothetical protein
MRVLSTCSRRVLANTLQKLSHEKSHQSISHQTQRCVVFARRHQFRSPVDFGGTKRQNCPASRHHDLVLLPVLLLRVLCHRTLRGSKLSILRALVVRPVSVSTTTRCLRLRRFLRLHRHRFCDLVVVLGRFQKPRQINAAKRARDRDQPVDPEMRYLAVRPLADDV